MAEALVHPTALVGPGVEIGAGTEIGPYAVLEGDIELGPDCWVGPHAVLSGWIRAGAGNRFFPYSSVGALSQDLWNPDEEAWVRIGDENVIRENVTINRGTSKEFCCTSIGDRNNIMAGCHIAHDCVIDDDVVLANNVLLGGHVRIRSHASVGGGAGVHHFVTIGRRAFVGGLTRAIHDVPPWMIVEGHPARVKAVNVVGARRHGLDTETINELRQACKRLFHGEGEGNRTHTKRRLRQETEEVAEVQEVLDFLDQQARSGTGRHLEAYRDDRVMDRSAIPAADRPRFVP